jgi:short-subunit dehydrogenase
VSDPGDCERIVHEAIAELGAIDLLVYAVGYSPLRAFAATTPADWEAVLRANLLGAHQVTRTAIEHMKPGAIIAALSSDSVGQPRAGLGAYATSKAALEESMRFSSVAVGATVPTEFGSSFDADLLTDVYQSWLRRGLVQEAFMPTDQLADVLAGIFAAMLQNPAIGIEHISLRSPSPVVTG